MTLQSWRGSADSGSVKGGNAVDFLWARRGKCIWGKERVGQGRSNSLGKGS